MKKKLLFIFSLFLAFGIFYPSHFALAQGTYELYNNLDYPITVDLYRNYWEKDDFKIKSVFIETIKLNPKQTHTCDFTQTSDSDIKSYQYRIQFKTCYYIKEIKHVFGDLHTNISSIIKPDNQSLGWYRIPHLS